MKYIKVILILLPLIFLISCNNVKFKKYNGKNLIIGVIGKIPEVKEENITFHKIHFEDLKEEIKLSHYDAIFITKENLVEASQEKYLHIYNECKVPFFFIENIKGHTPFIDKNLSYEDALQAGDPPAYATGIVRTSVGVIYTQYGLYNDIESKENIENVYSTIFTTISDNKTQ